MKGKNLITLGIGVIGGFISGSAFVVGKILKSECMMEALRDSLVNEICGFLSAKTTSVRCINIEPCLFPTYNDAKKVYKYLLQLAKAYGMVTVNDYYELSSYEDKMSYENNEYGWNAETVMDMEIVKTNYGYKIDIPPAQRLSK